MPNAACRATPCEISAAVARLFAPRLNRGSERTRLFVILVRLRSIADFDEYIPNAIAIAAAGRDAGVNYTYMTQSWVASLYLDCENAGMHFWPEIGNAAKAGARSLHCPNASSVAAFKAALKSGDIFFHAFAHNGQASTYPDASLFEAGIEVTTRPHLNDKLYPVCVDVHVYESATIAYYHGLG